MDNKQAIGTLAKKRYELYIVRARYTRRIAGYVQSVAVLIPILFIILCIVEDVFRQMPVFFMFCAFIWNLFVAILINAFGAHLLAQADLMMLNADVSINTSPFLSETDRESLLTGACKSEKSDD